MRLKTLPRISIAALLAVAFSLLTSACADPKNGKAAETEAQEIVIPTGLRYVDLKVGDGPEARAGKLVEVHYTGWLENGTKFDSSLDRNEPYSFGLGEGNVIKGWDEGVAGMKVGGKRKLTIPPDLGYGDQGTGGVIPPGATLIFEVELLGVQ
ncbi:MAG TPA: FKBP-type peptidyl-prolyl cis-trans isomerase [Thermoanaerobaculia bacterium]|nr:FKBP-type peptidyl-prolyl cis-trans isomerase [Thermoanaerobaculia bacterium]